MRTLMPHLQALFMAEAEAAMCPYREYDTETGETYACGLTAHSGKIKHTRGRTL